MKSLIAFVQNVVNYGGGILCSRFSFTSTWQFVGLHSQQQRLRQSWPVQIEVTLATYSKP